MQFRMGVNLGDVLEEEDRIYGDGVNIAARLENICEGGSVCISGAAFEHVENKLDLNFVDLGEHEDGQVITVEVEGRLFPSRSYQALESMTLRGLLLVEDGTFDSVTSTPPRAGSRGMCC